MDVQHTYPQSLRTVYASPHRRVLLGDVGGGEDGGNGEEGIQEAGGGGSGFGQGSFDGRLERAENFSFPALSLTHSRLHTFPQSFLLWPKA